MANIAYHPWFAEHGTKNFTDGKKWYETTETISSLYDCVAKAGTGNGRPDNKESNLSYINGQGGLICFSIPNAKTPSYKHMDEVKRNLVDGYVENGVEIIETLQTGGTNSQDGYIFVNISSLGDSEPLIGSSIYHNGVSRQILAYEIGTGNRWKMDVGENISKVLNEPIIIAKKSPYLATQGTTTHTDLIGNPANYPADLKALLASGKGVGFMNPLLVGQDGSDYTQLTTTIQSRKAKKLYPLVNITSMSVFTRALDTSTNAITDPISPNINAYLLAYQAQNQSAIPVSTPKAIQHVDRDLIASNHHSVYSYNGLTYAATGKVATGAKVESCGVDDVVGVKYNLAWDDSDVGTTVVIGRGIYILLLVDMGSYKAGDIVEYTAMDRLTWVLNATSPTVYNGWYKVNSTPSHKTINLDNDSIVGAKALITQTDNATQVFTQEMVYDDVSGFGDTDQFDQLTSGTDTDLNGNTIQTKILLKPSSCKLGDK